MEEEKLPKAKTISIRFDKDYLKGNSFNPRINLDHILKIQNKKLSKTLNENLEDHLVIYDEGLKLIISIHELCKSHLLQKNYASSFVVLSAKMVSLMLGIRQMIHSGLSDCMKNLNRPLIESFDTFQACLINQELNNAFSNTNEMYDNNDFFWKNFAKGKLNKECNKLYEKLEIEKDIIKYIEERKKLIKSYLSESIHSSFNAAFSSYLMMTIDFNISSDIYGKITTGFPRLLISLIEEISIFNTIFKLSLDKNISKDFLGIENQPTYKNYEFYQNKYGALCEIFLEKLENDFIEMSNQINEIKNQIKEEFEEKNNA